MDDTLYTVPLSPAICEVEPWIGLVCPAHPTDA